MPQGRSLDGCALRMRDFAEIHWGPGALLRGPHGLAGLPWRLRSLVWLSGGRIRWRTVQTVLEAGYADAFRAKHPDEPGHTLPASSPNVRLDYVFVPSPFVDRVVACEVVSGPAVATASDHLPVKATLRLPA